MKPLKDERSIFSITTFATSAFQVLLRSRTWVILWLGVLTVGCATAPALTPIRSQDQRIQYRGFSILPPQGKGWYLIARSGTDVAVGAFAKQIDPSIPLSVTNPQPHTARVIVFSTDLGSRRFDDPEKYIAFIKEQDDKGTSKDRFRVLESQFTLDDSLNALCVRIDKLVEDRRAPQFPGSVLLMTEHSLTCIHPDYLKLAVQIGYSQRAPSKAQFIELDDEAEPVIRSLQFTEMR